MVGDGRMLYCYSNLKQQKTASKIIGGEFTENEAPVFPTKISAFLLELLSFRL